jgi:hypothetical protein
MLIAELLVEDWYSFDTRGVMCVCVHVAGFEGGHEGSVGAAEEVSTSGVLLVRCCFTRGAEIGLEMLSVLLCINMLS